MAKYTYLLSALLIPQTIASYVLQLNGTSYYSPDNTEGTIRQRKTARSPTPFTYIVSSKAVVTAGDIDAAVQGFLSSDDVFSEAFLTTIFVASTNGSSPKLSPDCDTYGANSSTIQAIPTLPDTRSGPYILHPDGSFTKAYRLYTDPAFAFVESVVPGPDGSYVPITGSAQGGINGGVSIAVPSRLYYPEPSPERPLEGRRLAVKDIYNLKGTQTTAGSRAYFALGKMANETAPSVQSLIDLGAVVVGKSKTTFFALGEYPTADYVDQLAPFNPRGDGYQNPEGSSSGTGAGLASYSWLDFGTGSDTGGSVRLPSKQNGLFGMRITNASLPLTGIIPITPRFDTPGLLTRSASLLQTAYKSWIPNLKTYTSFPRQILLPAEFWPPVNNTSNETYTAFLQDLSSFLSAPLVPMSQNDSFKAYTNISSGIQPYLSNSFSNITTYDQTNLAVRPFISEYEEKFDRYPFLNPVPVVEWGYGFNVTAEGYQSAVDRVLAYGEWYRSELVPTCESSIIAYPFGPGLEDYRDAYVEPPTLFGSTYAPGLQAVYAAVPDYTVPIGTRKYMSKITKREEELPVTIGLIAAQGCEGMLADLVVGMAEKGMVVGEVKTGRTMY
ncbi:aspartyl/glutamyl-tRNA(Asn/Gln) amidotransferase, A subunit [Sphaceloma murrayae]|uniref:Aspartyl/glutamyl-tRNA(Asn/Gln) amidotransferase, A subunit n=1 Tax=Sphaceloma murrayae TaxID=2082308 RepID=A0A2K1R2Q3_9PEZI|nr:aspartyl/glutamyl-tRNA(Asn/Gln) amidotransferase, A subunit [Sphaceloma murrayae]